MGKDTKTPPPDTKNSVLGNKQYEDLVILQRSSQVTGIKDAGRVLVYLS